MVAGVVVLIAEVVFVLLRVVLVQQAALLLYSLHRPSLSYVNIVTIRATECSDFLLGLLVFFHFALTHLLPFACTSPASPPGFTGQHPGQLDGGAASAQGDPPQTQRVHTGGSGRLPPSVDAVCAHVHRRARLPLLQLLLLHPPLRLP